ncbi:MAG: LysR family transcriptional regulator [Deltaproteobacteria bacterium]|nr:LysR family transcriptional regulator [Deltaproteobacteria bacterium]
MELDQLRTFLAVLEQGSFTRAAEALHVGQSTVSFHIKALEGVVGTKLLDRLGGRVRPTASGKVLRRYAERIVSLRAEALGSLRAQEKGEAGRVAIAASTIPAEHLLPRALAELRRLHPGVTVSVDVSDSRRALAALQAQECDLALVGARVRDKRIVFTPFADDEIVLVGPSPNPFAPSGRLAAEEVGHAPLIVREEGSGTRSAVASILARSSGSCIQVGSTEAARRCVLLGLGLTLISRRAAEEDLAAGRLSLVRCPGTPVRRTFWIARLGSVTLPAATRALVRILKQ